MDIAQHRITTLLNFTHSITKGIMWFRAGAHPLSYRFPQMRPKGANYERAQRWKMNSMRQQQQIWDRFRIRQQQQQFRLNAQVQNRDCVV
jgi:hypothetical protein